MLVLKRIARCLCERVIYRTLSSSSRVSIKDIASSAPHDVGGDVTVLGWIKAVRKQKDVIFIDINDGSTPCHLQIIAMAEEFPSAKDFNLGCSLEARGAIVPSSHPGQVVEMTAKELTLLGKCNQQEYPFKARKHHGLEYIRQFPHLRARTNSFSSLLRIRHTAAMAIHEFFQKENFLHVHTPILTSSDCEGAGDLFEVKPSRSNDDSDKFFGCKAYLTVSGQLQAEALASGMHSVYTFGPTFRAEKSHTRRHLSEFYMVEAETVTMAADLQHLLDLIEHLYKSTLETVLRQSAADIEYYHNQVTSPEVKEDVKQSLDQPFKRLTYTEAVDILIREHKKSQKFEFEPKWGEDLQSEHEQFLVGSCGRLPVFITDYPASTKAFYARANEHNSGQTVAAVDLIVPGVGELVGGSLREERPHLLRDKLERLGLLEQYKWYMDLREFGTVPHGGFGLGFERYIQAILGLDNIRDVIPFPRYLGSCDT